MPKRLLLVAPILALAGCVAPPPYAPPPPPYAPPPYAPPPAPPPYAVAPAPVPGPTLIERLARDQRRINQGLRLGQFTPPENNELQGRLNAIEGSRRAALAENGGRFAPGQYEQLLARENALARTIFAYRHNGATPTAH